MNYFVCELCIRMFMRRKLDYAKILQCILLPDHFPQFCKVLHGYDHEVIGEDRNM
jgi:hypothetical protein